MFDPSPSIYFYTMTAETNLRPLPLQSMHGALQYQWATTKLFCEVQYISNDAVRAKSS